MANKSKKGRNPGAVDSWLDSIGLYRKNVAYDETCLFRAVSEQLFDCQIYHERVRKDCVDYGRENFFEFVDFMDSEEEWYTHMDLLEKHMVVCGNIEIQIISQKYNYDVMVFDAIKQQGNNVTGKELEDRCLMLCLMNEDHYDVVYKREHIQNAGFCQSIVYNVLYENVFKVDNVQDIVHGMLYEKEFVAAPFTEVNNNNTDIKSENEEKNTEVSSAGSTNVAPFPFKVAKALDPTIYRNIEYDSWTEVRRELRLGEWYYGDDNLILGTRCIYNDNNETYECYIQEIIKNQNKCIVYITKLAEKRTVNYTDLSPENDAKPWPLPYRFSKNLVVTKQSPSAEKAFKSPKKRKDKRRVKSNSESSAQSHAPPLENAETDVKAFVGVPLQMQNVVENPYHSPQEVAAIEQQTTSQSQHNLLVTPEIPSPMPKFTWEAPWNNYVPVSNEQVMWPHSPGTPQNIINFNMKPMIASAPVTPDVVPYHDAHYPYVYNYHVENYNAYAPWNPALAEYVPHGHEVESEQAKDESGAQEGTMVHYANYESYEQQPMKERPTLCTSMPNSPQVEMYSPIINIPAGTPVIYAHTPEMAEMMIPASQVQVYTPPVDVQYVSPGPYMYPPTPPTTAWYPPGINSQGFIFPAPPNMSK